MIIVESKYIEIRNVNGHLKWDLLLDKTLGRYH